ncbi:unnamed protein product [Cylicocyclus nassatus]|uniref:Uncharacterized protein n=1 Tax=Cylicocyclus nassatus TaxID=53992 RepID=A0AA36GWA7_CYLNA|nr:unnamed protein product [Cylicocyclus nassatus]
MVIRIKTQISSFYIELGENEKERQKKLDELLADFDLYKSEILKGMQLALRDIRSYEYDMEKNSGCHTRKEEEQHQKLTQ